MPKVVLNSSRNSATATGLVDLLSSRVNQGLNTTSDVHFNSVLTNDLVVTGNADIRGQMTFVESTVLKIKDNMIEINDGNAPLRLAGVQFNRGGLLAPYQLLYDEQDGLLKSGYANDVSKRIAHCESLPQDGGIAVWNSNTQRFDTQRNLTRPVSYSVRVTLLGGLVFEENANVPSIRGDSLGNVLINPRGQTIFEGAPVHISTSLSFGSPGDPTSISSSDTGVLSILAEELRIGNSVLRIGDQSTLKEIDGLLHVRSPAGLVLDGGLALNESPIVFGLHQDVTLACTDGRFTISSNGDVAFDSASVSVRELKISTQDSSYTGGLRIGANGTVALSSGNGVFECDSDFLLDAGRRLGFSSAPGSYVGTLGDDIVMNGARGVTLRAADGVNIVGQGGLRFSKSRVREQPSGALEIDSTAGILMSDVTVTSLNVGLQSRLIETSDGLVISSPTTGNVVVSQPLKILSRVVFGNGLANASIARSVSGELSIRNSGSISIISSSNMVNIGARVLFSNTGAAISATSSSLTLTSASMITCAAPVVSAVKLTATEVSADVFGGGRGSFDSLSAEILTLGQPLQAPGLSASSGSLPFSMIADQLEMRNTPLGVPVMTIAGGVISMVGGVHVDEDGINCESVASLRDLTCETLTVHNCIEAAADGGVLFSTPATFEEGFAVTDVLEVSTAKVTVQRPLDCASYVHVAGNFSVEQGLVCRGPATLEAGVDLAGHRITNLGTPRAAGDAVSKRYLESIAMGFRVLQSVVAASSAPVNVSVALAGTVDGATISVGSRVLLFGQTNQRDNGIYSLGADRMLTRAADMSDPTVDVSGASVFVTAGAQYSGYGFVVTSGTARRVVYPTQDAMIWTVFSGLTQLNATGGLARLGNDIFLDLDPASLTLAPNGKVSLSSNIFGAGLVGGNGTPVTVSALQPQISAVGKLTRGEWCSDKPVDVPYGGTGNTEYTIGGVLIGNGTQPIVATEGLVFKAFGAGRRGLASGLLNTASPLGELHLKALTPTIYLEGTESAGSLVFAKSGSVASQITSSSTELSVEHEMGVTLRSSGSSSYLRVTPDAGTLISSSLTVPNLSANNLRTSTITLADDASISASGSTTTITGPNIVITADQSLHVGPLTFSSDALRPVQSGGSFTFMDEQCTSLTLNGGVVNIPSELQVGDLHIGSDVLRSDSLFTVQADIKFGGTVSVGPIVLHPATPDKLLVQGSTIVLESRFVAYKSQTSDILIDVDHVQGRLAVGDILLSGKTSLSSGLEVTPSNGFIGGLTRPGWYYMGRLTTGRLVLSIPVVGQFTITVTETADPVVTFQAFQDKDVCEVNVYCANDGTRAAHVFVRAMQAPIGISVIECAIPFNGPYGFEGADDVGPNGAASMYRSGSWRKVFSSATTRPNMRVAVGQLVTRELSTGTCNISGTLNATQATFTAPSFVWSSPKGGFNLGSTANLVTQTLSASDGCDAAMTLATRTGQFTIKASGQNVSLVHSGVLTLGASTVGATFSDSAIVLSRPVTCASVLAADSLSSSSVVSTPVLRLSPGLDLRATSSGNLELGGPGKRITGLGTPINAGDACTKAYADALSYGFQVCGPARLAATGNVNLSLNPPTLIDGTVAHVGDTILLPVQQTAGECGLYRLESFSAPLAPITLALGGGKMPYVYVSEGQLNGQLGFTQAGTGALFTQLHGPLQMNAGDGLEQRGNRVSVKLRAGSSLMTSEDGLGLSADAAGIGLSGGAGMPLAVSSIAHLDTLGTVVRGQWNGTPVGIRWGGTGTNTLSAGCIPYSNGNRLVDGALRYDAIAGALGINTAPTEGLTMHNRNILLQRSTASSTSLQFTSGSYADAFSYVLRENDSGLQILCGNGGGTQQQVLSIDRTGKVAMSTTVAVSALAIGNVLVSNNSIVRTAPGPLNFRMFSTTNDGCCTNWYGSLGLPGDTSDSEFLRAGYYNGSYVLQTSTSGSGQVRDLCIQAGGHADQLLLCADGTVRLTGPVFCEGARTSISGDLNVQGNTLLESVSLETVTVSDSLILERGCTISGSVVGVTCDTFEVTAGQFTLLADDGCELELGHSTAHMFVHATSALSLSSSGATILLPSSSAGSVIMPKTSFSGNVTCEADLDVRGQISAHSVVVDDSLTFATGGAISMKADVGLVVSSPGGGVYMDLSSAPNDALYIGRSGSGKACVSAPRPLALSGGRSTLLVSDDGLSTQEPLALGGTLSVTSTATFNGAVRMLGGVTTNSVNLLSGGLQFRSSAGTAVHAVQPTLQKSMVPFAVEATDLHAFKVGGAFVVDTLGSRVDCMGSQVQNVADPLSPGDAVNKRYLDRYASGLSVRAAVLVASAAAQNIDLTRAIVTLDGITLSPGDRILLMSQTNAGENGAYVISAQGLASRAPDMPLNAPAAKYYFFVTSGATRANTGFICISPPGSDVVGTSPLAFTIYISGSTPATGPNEGLQLATQSGLRYVNGKLSLDPGIAGANVTFENGVLSVPILARDGVPLTIEAGGTGNTVLPAQGLVYSTGTELDSSPDVLRYDPVHRTLVLNSPSWSNNNAFTCGGDVCLTGLDRRIYFADQQTSTYKWAVGTNQDRDFVITRGDTQSKNAMTEVLRLDENGTLTVPGGLVSLEPTTIAHGGTGVDSLQPNGFLTVSADGTKLLSTQPLATSIFVANASQHVTSLGPHDFRSFAGIAIDTDVQAYSPLLKSVANMTAATGNIVVGNAGDFIELHGAAARDALSLGPLATATKVDNTTWAGEPLAMENGGTGQRSHIPGALLYADGTKLKGTPALLWTPDKQTLSLGMQSAPAHFEIIGGGGVTFDDEWSIAPSKTSLVSAIAIVSPDGEEVAHFSANETILHQARVVGSFSVAGGVDVAADVTVGGNLLISQGINLLGDFTILDPATSTERLSIACNPSGETLLATDKLTVDTGQTCFTGKLNAASLRVEHPTGPSGTILSAVSSNITPILKRAAFYDHGVATLYLTISCAVSAAAQNHFEIQLADKIDPFGVDPDLDVTVITSACGPGGSAVPIVAKAVPSTKNITVDWTSTSSGGLTISLMANFSN